MTLEETENSGNRELEKKTRFLIYSTRLKKIYNNKTKKMV